MGFNYRKEKEKFERKWEKLRIKYQKLGMPKESIDVLYSDDTKEFNSNRRYIFHTRNLPDENICEDNKTSMFMKFDSLSSNFDVKDFSGTFSWLDTIDSKQLLARLKSLKSDEMELLELYCLKGYKQREIALILGCTQQSISKKIKKIKLFLKNGCKK